MFVAFCQHFSDGFVESKSNRKNAAKPALQRTATVRLFISSFYAFPLNLENQLCVFLHEILFLISCRRSLRKVLWDRILWMPWRETL